MREEIIVEQIIDELNSRGRFDAWWSNISEETIYEIKEKLVTLIAENEDDVVEKIIDELYSRYGFDEWWGYIKVNIQNEIKTALKEIISV